MLLYTMLYIVLAYLMLFAAFTNSVCLNNASFFFLFKYFLCHGYDMAMSFYLFFYLCYVIFVVVLFVVAMFTTVCDI